MNLQGQKRGLFQNKVNNYHYLNGKRNTTATLTSNVNAVTEGVISNKAVINNNHALVSGMMNQDDNRFKPLNSISKSMGGSPFISTKIRYHMEEGENNKSSLGLFQQISNTSLSRSHNTNLIKQNEGASGLVNLNSVNNLTSSQNATSDFREKPQLSGFNNNSNNNNLISSNNNNNDSKKKRSRVIYCHVCCQYKPRSTRARFQVCQHIACYDCVRLALMIQQRYNVKAHCPFCQVELDWNKVKPFIVLFKPKPEVSASDDNNKTKLDLQQVVNVEPSNNSSLGTTGNNVHNSITNTGKGESNNNNMSSQIVSNDLITQAFECNGVSKEKILKGFFSCYLQKQVQMKNNGCVLQNNNNNNNNNIKNGSISQNMHDSSEIKNTCTYFSSMLDQYKPSSICCGGGNNNKQYFSSQSFTDQNNLTFPILSNSSESSCGEFLPDVVLAPIGEMPPLANCMHPTITPKKFNNCIYGGSFKSIISNNDGSDSTIAHNMNISNMNTYVSNIHNNNNTNDSNYNNTSISSNSSNSSSSSSSGSSSSSSSSISSIESNISNGSNTNTTVKSSKIGINNIGRVRGVVHGISCNCSSCLQQGERTGMLLPSMGLRIIPSGSILSKIYDENNPRGFACGLFNPSIPTDGVVLMQQGKSNKSQHIHFEPQKQFMADNLNNHSINDTGGSSISTTTNINNTVNNISTNINVSNNTNNHYDRQNDYNHIQNQNYTHMSYLIYGHNCSNSSTGTGVNAGNHLLHCEDVIPHSLTSYGIYNDENIRSSTGVSEILGFFETSEDKQMPSWMITTPCLNMKDILSDWRNSTLLKSHSDMVICSI